MPYVITTRREGPYWGPENVTSQSRRAVATLEEAHEEVQALAPERYVVEAYDAALALPESGGTIGPLPGGTVIEVAYASRRALWENLDAATQDRLRAGREFASSVTDADTIDAYNAQQST